MSRRIRTGFTLVELLVVITIIGILAGLLFPAIQAMRNSARQTECLNNITQVGKGTLNYESSKQRFPGFKNMRPGFPNSKDTNAYIVGWVPPMLSYLGRNDLYNMYSDVNILGAPLATNLAERRKSWPPVDDTDKHYRLSVLTCPADTAQEIDAEVQFVPNGGTMDNVANIIATPPLPPDYLENGISFDQTAPNPVKSSVSYVSSKDGVATTIMFTENEDADRGDPAIIGWDGYAKGSGANAWAAAQTDWNAKKLEYVNCVLWFNTVKGDPAPKVPVNKEVDDSTISQEHFARPRSAHSGGFNVVFCDGHARFVSEDISYDLYKALMSADGINGRDPFANPANKGTAPTHLDPVSDSQLDL